MQHTSANIFHRHLGCTTSSNIAMKISHGVRCWQFGFVSMEFCRALILAALHLFLLLPITAQAATVMVAAGASHICELSDDGGVKCWGFNIYGQLGDGSTTQQLAPVDVFGLASSVSAITAGDFHTCALTGNGGVKCWGNNSTGQLGDGSTAQQATPVDVVGLTSGARAIAAGDFHTCALTSGGAVKCWGFNFFGQLGNGSTTPQLTPVDVAGLTTVVSAIAAGDFHTCALTSNGGVKCWGNNSIGQLGDGSTTQRLTPVDVVGLTSGVRAIAAGSSHTCAVTSDGGVKCWGFNFLGQLGNGGITQQLVPVDVMDQTNHRAIATPASFSCSSTTTMPANSWRRNFHTVHEWNYPVTSKGGEAD